MIVLEADAPRYCLRVLGTSVTADDLRRLTELHLLPALKYGDSTGYLTNDLDAVVSSTAVLGSNEAYSRQASLFDVVSSSRLLINGHTTLDLPTPQTSGAYYAAARNIMTIPASDESSVMATWRDEPFFPPTRFSTRSQAAYAMAISQLEREESVLSNKATDFANSADYMGSKRAIAPFLIEAFTQVTNPETILVDLMCGSGAIAGAASRHWKVVASDAQAFSRQLAIVQGGGFDRVAAESALTTVIDRAHRHAIALSELLKPYLEQENALFHEDASANLRVGYSSFIRQFPILGSDHSSAGWNPTLELSLRDGFPHRFPYILFTTYFANIYFGLRQSIEIDSLRYGIDGLVGASREWALGALVASASKVSTNYGGHFAQPRVRDWSTITISELARIIERRSTSVFHEFAIRLMNLADESSRRAFPVETVSGPWNHALEAVAQQYSNDENVVVYFDPPYRRDEYSRYYHVLETLVNYNYPGAEGTGRTPRRGGANRYASEFATRKPAAKVAAIVSVIESILSHGWTCAWSYADVGDVEVLQVLESVSDSLSFDAWSLSAPHRHQSHRGGGLHDVVEYLVFMRPR
jgi:adenine-specific DNA-methyltransferase